MSNLAKVMDPMIGVNSALNALFTTAPPLRVFIILITSVWIGYTLQPVPAWLNDMFNTSLLFKLLILIFAGWAGLHPLDGYTSVYIVGASFLILALFEFSRVKVAVDVSTKKA